MPQHKSLANVHLTGLARDLAARAEQGKTIRLGVIGSGEMGTDLVTQGSLMQGVEVVAISTRRPHTAREALTIAFGDDARAWARDRAPMTLLVEHDGALPEDERRRIERFVAILGRQAE